MERALVGRTHISSPLTCDGLLAAANVPGPYVLAGHSVGGTYALAYAMDYPKDVAGVALIDSATPYQFDLPSYPGFYSMWRRVSALLPTLARAGIARVTLGTIGSGSLPADARRQARAFASSPRELSADRDEFAELRTVFDQVKALTSLGGKPLFVLTADVGQQSGWFAAQDRLATLSTNSVHQTAHGATHEALVEDEKLRGCYCPNDQHGRSLSKVQSLVSVAEIAQPLRARLRTPLMWGLVVGVAQAATPLPFWWLDTATVYALGLVAIASVYIGFAVADGRRTVLAVEIGVASMFVIIAAAAVTGTPWLLVVGLAGHGLKDLGSTAVSSLPTHAGGLRSALWSTGWSPRSLPSRSSPAFAFTIKSLERRSWRSAGATWSFACEPLYGVT